MCRFTVPFTLAALACASAFAQQSAPEPGPAPTAVQAEAAVTPLTLAAAVQLALDNNPELSSARREVEAVEGARDQAGVFPNPTLSMQMEDTRSQTRQTTVLLSQPIELGGKRSARIEAAERAVDIARTQLEAKQIELRAGVTAAFFSTLVAQDRVRLAQASLDLAHRGSDAAGKRVTAGKVSPVEETKAKVAEAGVRLELVQAHSELQITLQQLRALMGGGTPVTLVDGDVLAIPAPRPDASLEISILDAPSLREARLEARRLNALVDLERAKRIPDISLTLGSTRQQELGRNQALVGVSIPLPIFDTNRGNLTEALRRQDKAEDAIRAAELRLRTEVYAARQRYATSRVEVETLRNEVLPGAQSAFDAATKGFELGKFSYLEALDAQRTLLQARAQYLRSLAEAHRSITDLDRLLGGAPFTGVPRAPHP